MKAPRANWCPGSLTPPFAIDAAALKSAGPHTLSWDLSSFVEGGGWRISVLYFAFGD